MNSMYVNATWIPNAMAIYNDKQDEKQNLEGADEVNDDLSQFCSIQRTSYNMRHKRTVQHEHTAI